MRQSSDSDAMRLVWLASAGGLLLVGWAFILFQNNFHITPPVVFVCLGYGAGVAAVYTLFRTGASAVGSEDEDEDGDGGWGRPMGARGELEREKRALLKAIKEAEFDQQMNKLSKADADEMIGTYRARAIEVIKELDRQDGLAATAREQIEREVKARLEIAKTRRSTPAADEKKSGKKQGKKQRGKTPDEKTAEKAAEAKAEAAEAAEAKVEAKPDVEPEPASDAKADTTTADKAEAEAEAVEAAVAQDSNGTATSTKEATP